MPIMSRLYPHTAGRPMHVHELHMELGGSPRAAKWPDEGVPPTEVQGYVVRVLPRQPPLPYGRRGMHHRAQVTCRMCQRWFPFGRLAQHEPACKGRLSNPRSHL